MVFFSTGTLAGRVLAWLLVILTLGATDLLQVLLWGFLRALFPCSMSPLAGAAAWIGARGALGASGGMVVILLSFRGMVLRRPLNDPSGTKEP